MFVFKRLLLSSLLLTLTLSAQERVGKYQLADKISKNAYSTWDITIFPDGKNLPTGKGSYTEGKVLYNNLCMACHGENGKGGVQLDPYRNPIDTLVKSKGDSLRAQKPKKNIGTYWQYAPLLFDYIRRAMPYQAPKSLTDDEVYALTAYLLAENKIIPKTLVLNKSNLAHVKMPNVDGFICDNRVDALGTPCMSNCPVPSDKGYTQPVKSDQEDHLKSDCLIPPKLKF